MILMPLWLSINKKRIGFYQLYEIKELKGSPP